ncbi:ABC transporter substrate-binding protein [Saccharopolyspora flava]|uniref:NitT/TauT family transport system substrate-binding protein n=1 Tax=Saccharopolyspora flava TaxID=95161 RepID=A0A1I6RKX6_9PSEU|nr:ABC transporter substrate-binding protein [Saccharopolyspora flava]SFS65304.1 NitT/TauT family transport system substrate-binding protein [Saccharopolyspora flava]
MDALRISATANGLNYLPEYLADTTGLFRDAGLAVTARACDPWTGVLDDLASGEADLALGGLWVPGMYAGSSRELTVVCQLNHQAPKAIVHRGAPESFTLGDLGGKVVLAPGIGGSAPYAVTAGLIRESGADPDDVTFLRDLSTPMMVELFAAGLGDAIVLDLVTALEVEATGQGRIVFRNLDQGGIMPNSVYYCRTDRVEELRDRFTRFTACIDAAMQRLPETPAETIDEILTARWPGKDLDILREATRQMSASTVWDTVAIDPEGSDRWMRMLHESAMLTRIPGYHELADDSFMKDYR